jgi:glucose/arabinose dehydrogenase
MKSIWLAATAAGALLAATHAYAQTATDAPAAAPAADTNTAVMNKLEDFKSTGAKSIPVIPQDPARAADIEKTLAHIKLPPGFKISLYAQVPDARMIAIGPQGVVTFVSTRKNKIYALTDRTRSGHATEVKEFATNVEFKNPNGICFSRDGVLYSVEQNRILSYPAAEFFYEGADVAVQPIVKQGDLIPASEESFNHSARVCRIGPDNKLYVTVGQRFPWYGGGHTRTVEYKDQTPPADVVFPVVEEVAHAADLGMSFYTGKMFPKEYQGAIFSTQHGSWNRTVPVGARVMVTKIKEDGTAPEGSKPFAEGWLNSDGEYDGRPVDVEQMRDGSLLVSDDFTGAIYRITYQGK